MEHVCTICCKEKREDAAPLPAIERYLNPRIRAVFEQATGTGRPFLILSGKYGFLGPYDEIPWYDQRLVHEMVDGLVPVMVEQLGARYVTAVEFHGMPRETPGWGPYYDALEQACGQLDIPIAYRHTDMD